MKVNKKKYLKDNGWVCKCGVWQNEYYSLYGYDFHSALLAQVLLDKNCGVIIRVK